MELTALKNGTDIRGNALGQDGPLQLTDEVVLRIAKAFCVLSAERTGISRPRIALGHDPRLSSERIVHAFTEGALSMGCDVILTGLSSTPSMFMLLKDGFGADVSVMVTASHLPKEKNGLKFFLPTGGFEEKDITELLSLALSDFGEVTPRGKAVRRSYLEKYAADLVEKVRRATGKLRPLEGKKILVDAGNGAGGFYASLVLSPLGADTTGSQFLEPDGNFPNHIPNPENKEAMQSVCNAVKAHGADFGIIFDTDVDRAGAVGADGEEINRNRLIALISAILLRERAGATIVTDSVTSDGLAAFLRARGGVHHRFKRGYKNVINEAIRLNAEGVYTPLAIETSGHAALKENYFLDDGAYLVTRLLIALAQEAEAGRTLSDLISDLPEPKEAVEVRPRFRDGVDFKPLGKTIIEDFEQYCKTLPHVTICQDNHEGVRVNFEGNGAGWLLLRMSLHEPILPINAESEKTGGTKIMLNAVYAFLKNYPALDLSPIEKVL